MSIKFLILAACAGYGIWYAAVGGKQLDEKHVAALYRDYASAYDREDNEAVCELFSDRLHGQFSNKNRSPLVKPAISKASACSSVAEFYGLKRQLEGAAGHPLHTNINVSIQSITIAPDKKSATAEVLFEKRIGTETSTLFDMRSTQTDVIERDFGKAYFVQSDGSVSFFKSRP